MSYASPDVKPGTDQWPGLKSRQTPDVRRRTRDLTPLGIYLLRALPGAWPVTDRNAKPRPKHDQGGPRCCS